MKKIKIRYIILIIVLLFLAFNEGSRTLTRRFFEQRKLKAEIRNAQSLNILLKQRLLYLENEPSYFEHMVREELDVIAPGEVQYIFLPKAGEKK